MEELHHLQITSRQIAQSNIQQRTQFIEQGHHFWIARQERLFEFLTKRVHLRMNRAVTKPICHIQCAPGMGISSLLCRLRSSFPETFDQMEKHKNLPVIVAHLPVTGEIQEFIYEINEQLGLPNFDHPLKNKLLNKCFDFLNTVSLNALVIDDFEALNYFSKSQSDRFLDVLRYATSRFGFQILLIGGRHSHDFIADNAQLAARIEFVYLASFQKDDPDFIALLDDFEAWCPLQFPSRISADKMLRKEIIYRTNGSLRSILDLLLSVANHAIWNNFERINYDIWREYVG